MRRRQVTTALFAAPLAACSPSKVLPPLQPPDEVLIQRNSEVVGKVVEQAQLAKISSFVNARLTGWSTPWFGAPVGQVYFIFRNKGLVMGNFYVGPWFFGRDHGDFLSQSARKEEVAELGRIANLPLVEYVEAVGRR